MASVDSEPYSMLVEVVRSADVESVRAALERAGIPFHSGLMSGPPPRVLFYVPTTRLDRARDAIAHASTRESVDLGDALHDTASRSGKNEFPWGPVQWVAGLVLIHLLLVVWPGASARIVAGGLVPGRLAAEPWRLATSILLHADVSHALWNGLSTLVFAVPLLTRLGVWRSLAIYAAAGAGGGITATGFSQPGSVIVGSSGAVAGLFGAWAVLTYRAARREPLERRARIRTLGVALLFLPSLLNPATSSGQPISVSSHLGGLATGMVVGALLSSRMRLSNDGPGDPALEIG